MNRPPAPLSPMGLASRASPHFAPSSLRSEESDSPKQSIPARKRYSSRFGHRYAQSLGAGSEGSGSMTMRYRCEEAIERATPITLAVSTAGVSGTTPGTEGRRRVAVEARNADERRRSGREASEDERNVPCEPGSPREHSINTIDIGNCLIEQVMGGAAGIRIQDLKSTPVATGSTWNLAKKASHAPGTPPSMIKSERISHIN
ncbi:uncharacterized protein ARMOST_07604 [Armillaria ostoyae]|uniref:Uncharacterized protein n=1 Tax=Armillaria ostoyae TaxID=47428 RepID=A0A284R699_ARMOS|nr:uncharacterized protein ARMOST_07604 [Armillaria ostoyae]